MDEIKWIKIVTDVFDNRKIKMIESMPEGDTLLVVWFKILTLAGQINDGGLVYFTKDIPYTEQLLATQFNRPISIIQLALNTFERLGMIEIANDVIMVSNWEKYQNVDGMEKVREQGRIRAAKYRERQKLLVSNVTDNVTVTQCNAPEKEIRDKKNNTPSTLKSTTPKGVKEKTDYSAEFEEVWKLYPNKKGKPNALRDYSKARAEGISRETIENGIRNYIAECKRLGTQTQYIAHGSTWFHQRRWEDEYSDDEPYAKQDDLDFDVAAYAEQMKREGLL